MSIHTHVENVRDEPVDVGAYEHEWSCDCVEDGQHLSEGAVVVERITHYVHYGHYPQNLH